MARAAHTFEGLLDNTPLARMPAWLVVLAELRDELDADEFDRRVVEAVRDRLSPDYEDPATDPDLGDPT